MKLKDFFMLIVNNNFMLFNTSTNQKRKISSTQNEGINKMQSMKKIYILLFFCNM